MTNVEAPAKETLIVNLKTKFCEMPNAKLLRGRAQIEYSDSVEHGLKFRVSSKTKTFDFMFTVPGTKDRARFGLGTFPTFSLDEIRDKAKAARKLVEEGKDPRAVAAQERAAEAEAEAKADPDLPVNWTMQRLLDEYDRQHLNPPKIAPEVAMEPVTVEPETTAPMVAANDQSPMPPAPPPSFKKKDKKTKAKKEKKAKRSGKEVKRMMTQNVINIDGKPGLANLLVRDFEVAHMWRVLNPIDDRGAYIMTNRVFENLKRMLKFGVQQGCMKHNPLFDHEPPNEETDGDRFLSQEEIKHLWLIMAKALIRSPKVQLIVKVLLATGKRSNEICGAKRSEINWSEPDPTKRVMIIPAVRVKGEESTVQDEKVPLSKLAYKLLLQAAQSSNSEYLFPDDDADGPYKPGVVSKAIRLALEEAEGLPLGRLNMQKWTPHDLRRTVGNHILSDEHPLPGIDRFIKYLVLNHSSELKKNVSDRVYDQNKYLRKKRHGMVVWGDFISRLVGEKDCFEEIPREAVVPLAA